MSAIVQNNKFLAMTVGKLKLEVNGIDFVAMIDSGSELNVANLQFLQKANVVVDFKGMKWLLKGIHGNLEQLQGLVTDAPIKLGSHSFLHHLFVSWKSVRDHDIILGQPFLQWYSAQIDYDGHGATKLVL